jgi:hypothetical protein
LGSAGVYLVTVCVTEQTVDPPLGDAMTEEERLLASVRTKGTIRVIVSLNVPFTPEGQLSPEEVTKQRDAIAQAIDQLLIKLPQATSVSRFEEVPFVFLSVDEEGLKVLLSDPNVKDVVEDRFIFFPNLEQSAPPTETNDGPSGLSDCKNFTWTIVATEVCDGLDNDLDGAVDEGFPDTDADGTADCVDLDDDGDGFSDADEITAGSDALNAASTPEVCDGLDNDLDSAVDEGYP